MKKILANICIRLDSISNFGSIVSRARERIYKPEEFHYPDGIKHEQGRAERTLDS